MGMGIGMHSFFQEGMKNGNAFYFLGGMKIQTIFWVYFLNFFGDEKNGKKNHSFSQGMGMGMHSFFQMGMKNGNAFLFSSRNGNAFLKLRNGPMSAKGEKIRESLFTL